MHEQTTHTPARCAHPASHRICLCVCVCVYAAISGSQALFLQLMLFHFIVLLGKLGDRAPTILVREPYYYTHTHSAYTNAHQATQYTFIHIYINICVVKNEQTFHASSSYVYPKDWNEIPVMQKSPFFLLLLVLLLFVSISRVVCNIRVCYSKMFGVHRGYSTNRIAVAPSYCWLDCASKCSDKRRYW